MVLLLWESVWYLWEFWTQFYVLIRFLFPFFIASFSLSLTHPLTIGKHFCSYPSNAKSSLYSYYNLFFYYFYTILFSFWHFSLSPIILSILLCYSKTRCSLIYPLYHWSIYYYYYHHCNSSFKFFSVLKHFSSYVIIILCTLYRSTWLIITSVH